MNTFITPLNINNSSKIPKIKIYSLSFIYYLIKVSDSFYNNKKLFA